MLLSKNVCILKNWLLLEFKIYKMFFRVIFQKKNMQAYTIFRHFTVKFLISQTIFPRLGGLLEGEERTICSDMIARILGKSFGVSFAVPRFSRAAVVFRSMNNSMRHLLPLVSSPSSSSIFIWSTLFTLIRSVEDAANYQYSSRTVEDF